MTKDQLEKYFFIKDVVIDEGFEHEILWQNNLNFQEVSENDFLREISWVILSSGMRATVIEKHFPRISECFFNWESAEIICKNSPICIKKALRIFNNKKKIQAIVAAAEKICTLGFCDIKDKILGNTLETLQSFMYIGPITAYHLAKNIGLPVAKPDRHLVRIAQQAGYDNVQTFCKDVSDLSGDSVPVVDLVFWRYATIEPAYLNVLKKIHFNNCSL